MVRVIALLALLLPSNLDQPPQGLVPAKIHLADVLALHKISTNDHIVEDWAFTDTGASGTEHLVRSGENYHSTITIGSLVAQYGQTNGERWDQDTNQVTFATTQPEFNSFIGIRVNEDAADPKSDVKVLGETTGDAPAYVLEVRPTQSKHPEWIYYDAKNGNIVRVERIENKRRVITTYDDFRTVDGVTQAWHFHDAYPDKTLDDDWHITSFHGNALLPEGAFVAPPTVSHVSTVTSTEVIPATVTRNGAVFVMLYVNGRGLDFVFDSASPKSYINRDVARELGLPTFGHATQLADGTPLEYETILPEAHIGSTVLHNFAFNATEIAYKPSDYVKIVGVLGYDFLATTIVHIDYEHQRVELLPESAFDNVAALLPKGVQIPLRLDGGVPYVPMIIGGNLTKNVVLNDDLFKTTVFGSFTQAHPDQFKDWQTGKPRSLEVPFADDESYGKEIDFWLVQASSLDFAIANFRDLPILATNFAPETYSGAIDGMLGADYLQYFDLYFDFPDQRFFVQPNNLFYTNFHQK